MEVGVLMVVGSALAMDETTPFPGTAALVPVLGTALLVGAGARVPAVHMGSATCGVSIGKCNFWPTVAMPSCK